eukprot:1660797-Pleurochrysis_carterae.AAC.1
MGEEMKTTAGALKNSLIAPLDNIPIHNPWLNLLRFRAFGKPVGALGIACCKWGIRLSITRAWTHASLLVASQMRFFGGMQLKFATIWEGSWRLVGISPFTINDVSAVEFVCAVLTRQ